MSSASAAAAQAPADVPIDGAARDIQTIVGERAGDAEMHADAEGAAAAEARGNPCTSWVCRHSPTIRRSICTQTPVPNVRVT